MRIRAKDYLISVADILRKLNVSTANIALGIIIQILALAYFFITVFTNVIVIGILTLRHRLSADIAGVIFVRVEADRHSCFAKIAGVISILVFTAAYLYAANVTLMIAI